jgi:head-tail adaptor
MLGVKELADMRAMAAAWLADTCTILTVTRTADGMGGYTESWGSTTGVPCRLVALIGRGPGGGNSGDQYAVKSDWVLHLAHDQAIAQGQRVTVSGKTYEVAACDDDQTERASRRAWLKRVD